MIQISSKGLVIFVFTLGPTFEKVFKSIEGSCAS